MVQLRFNAELDYQAQAISSVLGLFCGQAPGSRRFGMATADGGVGNRLSLTAAEMLENLQAVQLRNGLPQSQALAQGGYNFDVEMETGTGKTYVYLRAIFELNRACGFLKFVVVVPSLAIKEGVYKSLQMTEGHFAQLYNKAPCDYFVYDSRRLEQVRSFAAANHISIMVINIDAFKKSFADPEKETRANIIHRRHDTLNGMRPIDLIQETRPIVIIDEPQSVDTTPKAAEAIASLNPLCIFRYSATHVRRHHLIYKLDAVDAYDLGLVKQIEVAGIWDEDNHNAAYLCLKSVHNKTGAITARVELDVQEKDGGIRRRCVTLRPGDDLHRVSKGRAVYAGYIVGDICCEKGGEYLSFTAKPQHLRLGRPVGGAGALAVREQQIRQTIREHLDKELALNKLGVKVLSLFFVDRVAHYREYDAAGKAQKGIYARLFEKHYAQLIRQPKYAAILNGEDPETQARQAHNGYFSADKGKAWKDTSGSTAADNSTYSLIMKDKEKLLSFDTRLRFIFSHSALREGWDNPNVFQICTLNETGSEVKKRQEVGRGLRLCVNQQGERLHGAAVNTLTVMANESYERFAAGLQHEYEEEQGMRFGYVAGHCFAGITAPQPGGGRTCIGQGLATQIVRHFEALGYIDHRGKVLQEMKRALKAGRLGLPAEAEACRADIEALCKKLSRGIVVHNRSAKRKIELNEARFGHPDFKKLWEHLKYKTRYTVDFDTDTLRKNCAEKLAGLAVSAPKLALRKARLRVDAAGVLPRAATAQAVAALPAPQALPDIVSYLQNRTHLTRRSIVEILIQSRSLAGFYNNPQLYMQACAGILLHQLHLLQVAGIQYSKMGAHCCYDAEQFKSSALSGYLHTNMVPSRRSIHAHVLCASEAERRFAEGLESSPHILLYIKLPGWYKIPTPFGSYTPSWAILAKAARGETQCFVLESRGAQPPAEQLKLKCAQKHFEALGGDVRFEIVDSFEHFSRLLV